MPCSWPSPRDRPALRAPVQLPAGARVPAAGRPSASSSTCCVRTQRTCWTPRPCSPRTPPCSPTGWSGSPEIRSADRARSTVSAGSTRWCHPRRVGTWRASAESRWAVCMPRRARVVRRNLARCSGPRLGVRPRRRRWRWSPSPKPEAGGEQVEVRSRRVDARGRPGLRPDAVAHLGRRHGEGDVHGAQRGRPARGPRPAPRVTSGRPWATSSRSTPSAGARLGRVAKMVESGQAGQRPCLPRRASRGLGRATEVGRCPVQVGAEQRRPAAAASPAATDVPEATGTVQVEVHGRGRADPVDQGGGPGLEQVLVERVRLPDPAPPGQSRVQPVEAADTPR